MKRWLIPLLTLAVLAGFLSSAMAANEQIYIRNQVFNGRVIRESGTVWLQVDDFLSAAKLPRSVLKSGVENGRVGVGFNNHTAFVPATMKADGMYIDGKAFVEGLGGRWLPNSSLGLIDVAVPVALYSRPAAAPPRWRQFRRPHRRQQPATRRPGWIPRRDPSSSLLLSTLTGTCLRPPRSAVKSPWVSGCGTWQVVIKNTAPDPVDGVLIVVHMQDGYGNEVGPDGPFKKDVGKLEGNAESTFEFKLLQLLFLSLQPQVEVLSNPTTARRTGSRWRRTRRRFPRTRSRPEVTSRVTEGLPSSGATVGGSVQGGTGGSNPAAAPSSAPGF